ncbi:MAG: hypothetical protein F2903_08690 [Actinobacteria bacterium]|uniref:Unannotated protein n=1 Tax=freshwater metagenome TaxID=449393 RepID=A0A6J7EIG6_9ZZZZ|nr:hypothetical protein [Actinomycetota bacterium]MSX10444.1 hypothetical protein [Actinomycetota bacterium]MSX68646.1 hypothetical protein [Actinomycetota bacterium]
MSSSDPPLIPRPERLDSARHDFDLIIAAHGEAVRSSTPTYRDPTTGLMVFTSAALLERGWCCERGCRHCPFPPLQGPLKVEEP